MSDRTPPFSDEAEKGLIGSVLLEPLRVMPLAEKAGLTESSFFAPAHRTVWAGIRALMSVQGVADLLLLTEWLEREGKLAGIGGAVALEKMVDATPTAAHAEYYLDIVRQKALLRNVIAVCRETENQSYAAESGQVLASNAVARLTELAGSGPASALTNEQRMDRQIERWEKAHRKEAPAIGLELPWAGKGSLTELMCGLEPGLTILAGRPSQGKTTIEDQIACHAAAAGIGVGRFPLDGSPDQLLARALCRMAGVSMPKLKFGFAGESQLARIRDAREILGNLPLYFSEQREIRGICAEARAWKLKHNIGLLTIDFMQLVEAGDMGRYQWDKNARVGYVSGMLKALSNELGIPVLVLSQLSRGIEKEGREPELSDLRDSGCIEQDADKVAFAYKDEKWCKKADQDRPGTTKHTRAMWVDLLKHKDGETGRLPFWMRPPYFLFEPAGEDFTDKPEGELNECESE